MDDFLIGYQLVFDFNAEGQVWLRWEPVFRY